MKGHEILFWNIYCVWTFYQVVRQKTDVCFLHFPEALNNDRNMYILSLIQEVQTF